MSAFPKISKPLVTVIVPSTKRPERFRMMTRREEKILLVARQTRDEAEALAAVRQVVVNCSEGQVDVDRLPIFDVEYVFIKLRAASVGSKEKLTFVDHGDEKEYQVDVDLDDVEVVFPPEAARDGVIELSPTAKIKLRWPSALAISDERVTKAADPEVALDLLTASCVETLWVDGESYSAADTVPEEVVEFLQSLGIDDWDKIRKQMSGMPHLSYWVSWTNSKGEVRRLELKTLTDFFTLA